MTVAARKGMSFVVLIAIFTVGCAAQRINTTRGVVPDAKECNPGSSVSLVIAKSQSSCHQGVAGDGVQILLSKKTRRASLSSDTARVELTSIFLQPSGVLNQSGSLDFKAFYSSGLLGLSGKTGCVGILDEGSIRIEATGSEPSLEYRLKFRLVSPLGWEGDCTETQEVSGTYRIQ